MTRPIQRETFDAAQLVAQHPPILHDANKQIVQALAFPPGASAAGTIEFTRWAEPETPAAFEHHPVEVAARPGVFPYEPALDGTVSWHMNFADRVLFGYYASSLFAQDEIQVAEHPALASLRQALSAAGRPPVTVQDGRPTPALVTGVERRCAIRTEGIYGNAFARASRAAIEGATRVIVPPTRSNIVAIEAPKHGHGPYDRRTVEYALSAAFTGFLV